MKSQYRFTATNAGVLIQDNGHTVAIIETQKGIFAKRIHVLRFFPDACNCHFQYNVHAKDCPAGKPAPKPFLLDDSWTFTQVDKLVEEIKNAQA